MLLNVITSLLYYSHLLIFTGANALTPPPTTPEWVNIKIL